MSSTLTQIHRYALTGATREIGLKQTMMNQALQREDIDSIRFFAQEIEKATRFILTEVNG